jgi:hypothetical protein
MYGAPRGLFAILLYVQIFEEDRWACQMRVDFRVLRQLKFIFQIKHAKRRRSAGAKRISPN